MSGEYKEGRKERERYMYVEEGIERGKGENREGIGKKGGEGEGGKDKEREYESATGRKVRDSWREGKIREREGMHN